MSLERLVRAGRVELPLSPYKEASLPLTDARKINMAGEEGLEPSTWSFKDSRAAIAPLPKMFWNARLESNQRVPV